MKKTTGTAAGRPQGARTTTYPAIPPCCRMQRSCPTRFVLLAVFALLLGCGTGDNNHGYGYEYDQIGATGLRVRWAGTQQPSLADIEKLYQETEACTGISASGPLVIFTDPVPSNGGVVYGSIFLDTGTVFISTWLNTVTWLNSLTYKHEFVHYLLHQSGFDITANANHRSPLFTDCTQWPAP
mgnify:CR=1 FL=1